MSDNNRKKIKTYARLGCCIGIIASALLSFIMVLVDTDKIFVGILILLFGSLFSCIGLFIIYCFDKLLDTVCNIEYNTRKHKDDSEIDKYAHPNWHHAYHKNNK